MHFAGVKHIAVLCLCWILYWPCTAKIQARAVTTGWSTSTCLTKENHKNTFTQKIYRHSSQPRKAFKALRRKAFTRLPSTVIQSAEGLTYHVHGNPRNHLLTFQRRTFYLDMSGFMLPKPNPPPACSL